MLFERADVVVTVSVDQVEERQFAAGTCAHIYTGRIERRFKANRTMKEGAPLTFGRYEGLQVGRKYLIFARFQDDVASVIQEIRQNPQSGIDRFPQNDVIDAVRCRGTVPGLNLIEDAAWLLHEKYAVIRNMPPSQIPTSIRVMDDLPRGFRVDLEQLYLYLDDLKRWDPAR